MTKEGKRKGSPLSVRSNAGSRWVEKRTGAHETKPVPPPLWPAEQQTMVASLESQPTALRGPHSCLLSFPPSAGSLPPSPHLWSAYLQAGRGCLAPSDPLGAQLGDIENLLCLLEAEA